MQIRSSESHDHIALEGEIIPIKYQLWNNSKIWGMWAKFKAVAVAGIAAFEGFSGVWDLF